MSLSPGIKALKVYGYALLAMLFWGLSFVWFKIVVQEYRPITIIFLRLIFSGGLLLIYLSVSRNFQKIARSDIKWFLLLSFSQPFCYFLGESFGLQLVSSTVSSVIISTIPLFSPVAAYIAYKEKISSDIFTGIIFSFIGIIFMLINPDLSFNAAPRGVMLLFVAVISAVAYSVIIRKLAFGYHPATIIVMQNLVGAVYFLPLFLLFDFSHFISVRPGSDVLWALLQLTVFASTLSYVFYIISIREIGIVKANVLTNLIPVFTAVFSFYMLAESFTAAKIIGMLFVMAGVVIAQYRSIRQNLLRRKKQEGRTD